VKALAALTLLFFATPTLADLTYVPKWTMQQDMACYNLDQAKLLVNLDSKLVLCDSYAKEITELRLSNDKLREAGSIKQEQLDTIQGLADSLTTQLNTCIVEKNDAIAKADSSLNLWVIILGAGLLLAVGAGVGVWIGSSK
jgi:hypothetical protein